MTEKVKFKIEKLIRDKLPEILAQEKGTNFLCRTLEMEDYIQSLKNKLLEETQEVLEAQNQDELKDELADVLEVMLALIKAAGFSLAEIEQTREERKEDRGAFEKRVYCEHIEISSDNHYRLDYYRARADKYPRL